MKKALFIDSAGTIIREPEDGIIDSLDSFRFMPGAITGLSCIVRETDFELVLVKNKNKSLPSYNRMLQILRDEGVEFAATGRLSRYLSGGVDLENSYLISRSIEPAEDLDCKIICFNDKESDNSVLCTTRWNEICDFLKSRPRSASVHRKTKETEIVVKLCLEGSGKSSISTGIGFLDHMLDQIATHGNFNLEIEAEGDLSDDGHHITEDIAICLGEAFQKATGTKKGVERYGFMLPMDDSLAQVAVDIGGRSWLVWDVEFANQTIGGIPSEMFFHFFKTFCDNAKCSLNIKAEGNNDHHKIEAVFKAFARAMKQAVSKTENYDLPSTKGKI